MSAVPPRISDWLLQRSLSAADRPAVVGDLHEEYRARLAAGPANEARRWYRRQVWRSVAPNLRRRFEQARGAQPEHAGWRRAGWSATDGLVQDLRYAVRSLRSTPTFTVVALLVLTLGIGATTAIFSVVDGVALRGVPFPHGSRLMVLTEPRLAGKGGGLVPAADFADWRAQQTTFEDLAAVQGSRAFVQSDAVMSETLRASVISASLFPLLRVSPAIGRSFTPDDEVPGREREIILSDAFWRRRFAGDPAVIGRTMTFDSGVWTIVGVMPASFAFPPSVARPTDIWAPYAPGSTDLQRGRSQSYSLQVLGRLKDGVSLAQARADLEAVVARAKAQSPLAFAGRGVEVMSLLDSIVGSARSWMLMLLAAVTFVLLIACVNVANLVLARATVRARGLAVRAALGASRWRLLRGLLLENLLLSVAGTVLGVGLAVWCVAAFRASLPAGLPRVDDVAVNYRVLLAAAIAAVTVAVGVTPIWQSSSGPVAASLGEAGRSAASGAARHRVRVALLIAEVALAVVLLVGSGLFIASFVKLVTVDLGFDLPNVLSVDVVSRKLTAAEMARTAETMAGVLDEVRRIPDVQAAALVSGTQPLVSGNDRTGVTVPGKPVFADPDDTADEKFITPGYFDVLRVPVIEGRAFTDADRAAGAPPVVLLNDVAAKRYFDGASPLGATILISGARTVVGVVRSVRLQGPESDLRPEIYLPLTWDRPFGSPLLTLMMRSTRAPASQVPAMRAAIRAAAPGLSVPDPQTYDERFESLVAQRRFNMIVLALFGMLAMTIAAAGIYGVMAYLVEQQTQEIGVRLALGAEPASVLRMVLSRAALYMTAGIAIGLAGGWLLARFVQAFLFRIDGHDLSVYAAAATTLFAAGLLAAFVPARRAARVDPVIALRSS